MSDDITAVIKVEIMSKPAYYVKLVNQVILVICTAIEKYMITMRPVQ